MIKYYIYFSPVFEYVLFCPTALYFFVFPVLRFLLRYPMTINIKYKIVHTSQHHIHTGHWSHYSYLPINIIIQSGSLFLSKTD